MSARGGMIAALIILGATACGEGTSTPELSEVTLSHLEIRSGEEFFASFEAIDPDGDLDRATVAIRIEGPENGEEEVDLESLVATEEVAPGDVQANMSIGMTLRTPFTGVYKIELRVTDGGGHESDPAKARVRVIF